MAILQQFESGSSRREIEKIFKCSQSTICRILVNKESILNEARNCNGEIKDNLTANNYAYKELYRALTKWAEEMKQTGAVITAHVAREKAEELSRNMGRQLSPSNAWLYKWKEREGVVFARKTRETEHRFKGFIDNHDRQTMLLENLNKESNHSLEVVNKKTEFHVEENIKHFTAKNLSNSMKGRHKSYLKRGYTKRLPIVDASGEICRSRKEKTFLTLLQKLEILQRLRNGERRPDLSLEYNLSQSALSQVINDEKKILRLAAKGQNLQMKIIRSGIFREGEIELNKWVLKKMAKGVSLTRTQVKNRAKKIAESLHINFKASTGWLEKWKARMNMDFNENQILQRKIPTYQTYESCSNSYEEGQGSNAAHDHFEIEDIKPEIEEYNFNVITPEPNLFATELLTPQQFYLKTIQNDRLAEQRLKECKGENKEEQNVYEDNDIKPLVASPTPLDCTVAKQNSLQASSKHGPAEQSKDVELDIKPVISTPSKETELFHQQIHSWLQRYNIENSAAKELLDILNMHIDNLVANAISNTTEHYNH